MSSRLILSTRQLGIICVFGVRFLTIITVSIAYFQVT